VKYKARKGVTIVYAKKLRDPDGRKRQVVDVIPPDRDAFIVWKDQFGSIHATGFGDVELPDGSIQRAVKQALKQLLR
jgi:hypothetical protein